MNSFDPSIFRAYDIRGTYPNEINEKVAYAAGQAFVKIMGAKRVAVGRDVRASGQALAEAVMEGVTDAGADVIEIGVISTEMLYFAAATLDCDGGMSVTASHNPKEWNGIKFIAKGGSPITREEKLGDIYQVIQEDDPYTVEHKGTITQQNLTDSYINYLRRFIPESLTRLRFVANVNFGANGQYVDPLIEGLPLDLIRLNWEQDGTFPKGTPDPLLPKNRTEIIERIQAEQADFGVAWDADADRCFFYDEKGRPFPGYYVTAQLIKRFLGQDRGGTAIIERRLTWANLDAAQEVGGKTIFSRTGHGYIKKAMRDNNAIFGGETSGHYYYRDYFYCDSGLVTFLSMLGEFARHISSGHKISEMLDGYFTRYPISPEELNYITPHAQEIIDGAAAKYGDATQDHEDGLTVEYPQWRFNLRMSSNEPVLRLNMEAKTPEELKTRMEEVQQYIGSFGANLRDDHA